MSKAFVLKNNEELYYTTHLNYEDIHTEDISEASIYNREIANDIKLFLNKSTYGEKWEVVEITIAETKHLEQDINESLKQQLVEKDKEIEELKKYKKGAYEKYVSKCAYLQQQIKDARKQVCDKIKKVIEYHSEWYEQGYVINMVAEDLLKEIDKVNEAYEKLWEDNKNGN